jgi:cobalamin synthase
VPSAERPQKKRDGLLAALNRKAPTWWISVWIVVLGTLAFIFDWSDVRAALTGIVAIGATATVVHRSRIRAFIRRGRR